MADEHPKERHESTTKWKLVEIRCEALVDAAKSARAPFVLALLWAFVWGASTYTATVGYLQSYQARYEHLLNDVLGREFEKFGIRCNVESDSKRKCDRLPDASASSPIQVQDQLELACTKIGHRIEPAADSNVRVRRIRDCAQEMANRINRTVEALQKEYMVTLPGFSPVLHQSDLGVVGALGLVLILLWLFFSMRRENHAIASFVNAFPRANSPRPWDEPFLLCPQEKYWSAEHYAFAYSAVSQRFMFLFSTHSFLLHGFAVFLVSFPAIVATVSFLVDAFTAYDIIDKLKDVSVAFRLLAELALLGFVIALTWAVVRYVVSSNRLLNAWYIATRDVWVDEWDERDETQASQVTVDLSKETAERINKAAAPVG